MQRLVPTNTRAENVSKNHTVHDIVVADRLRWHQGIHRIHRGTQWPRSNGNKTLTVPGILSRHCAELGVPSVMGFRRREDDPNMTGFLRHPVNE